jgi:transcriptional regulator with XRE-family HTH domain
MSYDDVEGMGERIAQIRGELTQKQFADRLGINPKTVQRWEAGSVVPDGPALLSLLREFGADPAWVLMGRGSAPPLTARESALIQNYRATTEEGRRALEAAGAALSKPAQRAVGE